jgi:F0F1-type ATP synthase gamma subunit
MQTNHILRAFLENLITHHTARTDDPQAATKNAVELIENLILDLQDFLDDLKTRL